MQSRLPFDVELPAAADAPLRGTPLRGAPLPGAPLVGAPLVDALLGGDFAASVRRRPKRPDGERPAKVSHAGDVVFVRHPRARRYSIRVLLDGMVRVTLPRRGTRREAAAFVEEQREWIARARVRVAELRATRPPELPSEVQRALRRQAARDLPARLRALADALGLRVARVSVRNQRRRWGSCSADGHICLNWRLVTMPDWVRDYVLYHELMHLKRMDHSPLFWRLVAAVCPVYQEARAWLRTHGDALHGAAPHGDVAHGAPPPRAAAIAGTVQPSNACGAPSIP